MAATATVKKKYSTGRTGRMLLGTIALTGTYTTNGEAITLADAEYVHYLHVSNKAGYSFEWDGSTSAPKVKAFYVDNNAASDSAQIEVPNATDITGATGAQFMAIVG